MGVSGSCALGWVCWSLPWARVQRDKRCPGAAQSRAGELSAGSASAWAAAELYVSRFVSVENNVYWIMRGKMQVKTLQKHRKRIAD